jgi:hypothetical protein
MDWGQPTDPGLNLLGWNGPFWDECNNLSVVFEGPACPVNAVGNYWGRLDTRYVWAHILQPPGAVSINPVAASSRWFSIAFDYRYPEGDLCETDVLVTGDLAVSTGGTLRIAAGTTFEFTAPDNSEPGGDPAVTELIVRSASPQSPGTLTVVGTAEAPVIFRTSPLSPIAWWGGIRVTNFSGANISHARIRHAYVGVDVQPVAAYGSNLQMTDSRVDSCAFAGVRMNKAWVGVLSHDSITDNGVCEIELCPPDDQYANTVNENWILNNGIFGIHVVGPCDGSTPSTIWKNTITSPATNEAAVSGIYLEYFNGPLTLRGNHVSGFHSDGLGLMESYASSRYDTLVANSACNLRCSGPGTNLVVRGALIDSSWCGVYADIGSYPDLGTEEDYGNNSILMANATWVENSNAMPVQAVGNWWGTVRPDTYAYKFVGPVDYSPWLAEPPEDGGQSAGSAEAVSTGLGECRPSPVTRTATINYSIGARGVVSLQMLDLTGRVVRDLATGVQEPGRYAVTWDGRDARGRTVARGVYFYRLDTPGFTDVKKAVMVK